MSPFDPENYGPVFAGLLRPPRLMPLGPGTPNQSARGQLDQLAAAFNHAKVHDGDMADCCRAAVWLLHDFADQAHAICQEIHTPSGSWWHAILHRREPDYGNSKYWFHRVGAHPLLPTLAAATPALGYTFTSPEAFVDFCEQARGADEALARQVQQLEWQLLFDWCYRRAAGASP